MTEREFDMPEEDKRGLPAGVSDEQSDGSDLLRCGDTASPRPRVWPAVLVELFHLVAFLFLWHVGTTKSDYAVALGAVPIMATSLLIVWWLLASRAPLRDRLAGLVLFLSAVGWVVFTQGSRIHGVLLLAYAVPLMTGGSVVILVVTRRLRWSSRRWMVAGFLGCCAIAFTLLRLETMGGNLTPVVSFRWSATATERSTELPLPTPGATAILPAQAGPGDWPGFRGAARDGRVNGTTFSTDWSTPPRELWRRPLGPAWSSFASVGGYLFTQEQCGEEELVTCYDAATGASVWVNRVTAQYEDPLGLGPRATPAFSDGRLYAQGATGVLQCLDAATGRTIWKRVLTADVGESGLFYGFTSSPLIVGERVFTLLCGGEGKSVVVACDCRTGDEIWRRGHGTSGYSSPHLATIDSTPQILMATNTGMQSFAPDSGDTLWEHVWTLPSDHRCIQPLIVDEHHIMLGGPQIGSRLLSVEKSGNAWNVTEQWTTEEFRPFFNDCVLHKGFCYGFDGDRVASVDMTTGQRRWEGKRYGGQLLLLADMNMLLILSQSGDVVLVRAIPEEFAEVARFKALRGKTWNHPLVTNGKLVVRNAKEAACFELR